MIKNWFSKHSSGIGPAPGDMAKARMRAMALIASRAEQDLAKADHEQAKQELIRKKGRVQQEAILDALPENKPWDEVTGSGGRQTSEPLSEEEDAEGRSEEEQLVDKGFIEAERDTIREAERAPKNDGQASLFD